MGGGGGGAFTPRTDDQLDLVPAGADAAVAIGSGCIAAASVAPFLMCVDRAVTAAAAGQTSSVWRGIVDNVSEFVRQPHRALRQPALWMVAGVYAGTYAAANLSDVVGERAHASANSKAAGKFTATTGANMLGGIAKDAAFARMFGAPAAGAAAGLIVPFASYGLFATRDALTVGGAFFLPGALSNALVASGQSKDESTASAVAQLVSPPLMQVVCTPMHLLALNMVNAPVATLAQRVAALKVSTPPALVARSLRMLPAYGIGGILNTTLSARGRDAARRKFLPSAEDLKAVKERLGRRGGAAAAKLADAKGRKAIASIGVAARRGIVEKTKGSEFNPTDDTGDVPFTLRTGTGGGGGGGAGSSAGTTTPDPKVPRSLCSCSDLTRASRSSSARSLATCG
mmetsp:Transcript_5121/g.23573  ORF Transcript_5121/g.23573 Transcript_5121/m.23573 type:complete len:400 (+) Transcript_5121:170-1369(+)